MLLYSLTKKTEGPYPIIAPGPPNLTLGRPLGHAPQKYFGLGVPKDEYPHYSLDTKDKALTLMVKV